MLAGAGLLAGAALLVAPAARGVEPGALPVGTRSRSPAQTAPTTVPQTSALSASAAHAGDATRDARIDKAVRRGVKFLVASQTRDGAWGTGTVTRGFEIMAAVPSSHDGFRAATTGLCVMALREAGAAGILSPADARAAREAHDRGVEFLIDHGDSRRADGLLLYNTWGHIFATQALSEEILHCTDPRLKARLVKAAQGQIHRLQEYETYIGGWNYYDFDAQTERPSMGPTSFGTAAGLVALWEARQAGLDVPQRMVDLSLHRLAECRLPNGAFLYGSDYKYVPRLPANMPKGALGRDQPCNYALWLWNDKAVDDAKAREGLEYFFKEHEFIDIGRQRQFPHEAWYQTAPYYYYYDHYYAARLIDKLGPTGKRAFDGMLADDTILPHQETDGSWWDFAMWDYHKPYGTSFAIMTLLRCRN